MCDVVWTCFEVQRARNLGSEPHWFNTYTTHPTRNGLAHSMIDWKASLSGNTLSFGINCSLVYNFCVHNKRAWGERLYRWFVRVHEAFVGSFKEKLKADKTERKVGKKKLLVKKSGRVFIEGGIKKVSNPYCVSLQKQSTCLVMVKGGKGL